MKMTIDVQYGIRALISKKTVSWMELLHQTE